VATFLSDEWIDELAHACRTAPAREPGADAGSLVIEPVVRDVPGRGEVRYRIAFDGATGTVAVTSDGTGGLLTADDAAPDVRLETDYVTAVALSRGTANAQEALADGRMRVSGAVARLAPHAAALARLDDLFAAVRSSTTYPAP
jgi:SCP-2 sterol transfer family